MDNKKISLLKANINQVYLVDEILLRQDEEIVKRLKTLGFVRGARVCVLKRSKFSKAGIVRILGANVCLDYNLLDCVLVK